MKRERIWVNLGLVMLIGFLFSTDHVAPEYEDLGLARVSVQETE